MKRFVIHSNMESLFKNQKTKIKQPQSTKNMKNVDFF